MNNGAAQIALSLDLGPALPPAPWCADALFEGFDEVYPSDIDDRADWLDAMADEERFDAHSRF